MKELSVLVPECHTNLSSVVLTYEILLAANEYYARLGKKPVFNIQLVSNVKTAVSHNGLFSVHPGRNIKDKYAADLVIIPSVDEHFDVSLKRNKDLINWITQQYIAGAELASLCTGAFLLAATGLLKDRQCSTHWLAVDEFRRQFPDVHLATEKVITDEHGVYTAGGAISAMNLVLYIIEKFYDRETAIYCAKVFEIDIERNSQSPFMIFVGQKKHGDEQIKKAQLFMEENFSGKIVMEDLASKFFIDRRNFDRRFIKATAYTAAEYLHRIKIEAAKKSLETTRKSITDVMYDIGYSDTKTFRSTFKKITGLSPIEYRSKYNKEAEVL